MKSLLIWTVVVLSPAASTLATAAPCQASLPAGTFKAHLEFIRQKKHQDKYGIKKIRAVLIETLDTKWAEELRQASAEVYSDGLFWFTAFEIFTIEKPDPKGKGTAPLFLQRPEIVLNKVWATKHNEIATLLD